MGRLLRVTSPCPHGRLQPDGFSLLKAWELAHASSRLQDSLRTQLEVHQVGAEHRKAGMPEFLDALQGAFMQSAWYEFRADDDGHFRRLFIRTDNVPNGIEVTSERIFEQALCALVKELKAPMTADAKAFGRCREAVIKLLNDPANRFAHLCMVKEPGTFVKKAPWRIGSEDRPVARTSLADPERMLSDRNPVHSFRHNPGAAPSTPTPKT